MSHPYVSRPSSTDDDYINFIACRSQHGQINRDLLIRRQFFNKLIKHSIPPRRNDDAA